MRERKKLKNKKPQMIMEKNKILARILEFFIIGVVLGILEDMIAIFFYTHENFNFNMVWIAALVAIPFAIISELIVDYTGIFRKLIGKIWKNNKKQL